MDVETNTSFATHDLKVVARVTERDIHQYRDQIMQFILRRFVDTLYEEMLPHVREAVLQAFEPAEIAKHIEAEMKMALTAALRGDK